MLDLIHNDHNFTRRLEEPLVRKPDLSSVSRDSSYNYLS